MERWFYLHDLAEQIEAQKAVGRVPYYLTTHEVSTDTKQKKEFTIKKTM